MCQYHASTKNWKLACEVISRLQAEGYEAFLVGGCVRDHLLGVPSFECDVATEAPPQKLIQLFGHHCKPVGIEFGVVLVAKDGMDVDVATYRTETGYADHRHPSHVKFGTRSQDAQRRDFTINALYWDPFRDVIYDDVGGRDDLGKRILRAVGNPDKRFEEDALRVLRGLRFAASFGFSIEPLTWNALCRHAEDLKLLSAERIYEELTRGFISNPARFLELLDQSGALTVLLPEVAALKGVAQPPEYHPEGDVFTHTKLVLEKLPPHPSTTLVFAALFHDLGKPATRVLGPDRIAFPNHDKVGAEMADTICQRLKFPKAQREHIVEMVRRHMMFISIRDMRPAKRARFLATPTIDEEIELHRADCLASHGNLENYEFARAELQKMRENSGGQQPLPEPLINGHDLRDELKIPPGPIYRKILDSVLDAQLEGRISNREQALALAQELAQKAS
ncbi:MAG: CCA tRNA nucleotidyltransferase [Candidatus Sumerlaeaceae bacterium]|nr:CCA tRNA nucleotidyltransferase [Candidatus Sumerlaeaceae bacterium]